VSKAVIGTASLLVEQKFIHQGGMVGHIEDVSVRLGYEKRGIGTALVRHATEQARKLGCYKVILDCSEHLIPFYAALGFRCHAVQMRTDLCCSSDPERRSEHASKAESRSQCKRSEIHDPNPVLAAASEDVLQVADTR
jgi:predicted N-acetyltransferase YhbS